MDRGEVQDQERLRRQSCWPIPEGGTIGVPMGYAEFPKEILIPPRSSSPKRWRAK